MLTETKKVRLKRRVASDEPEPQSQAKFFVVCLVAVVILFLLALKFFVWRKQANLNTTANLQSKGLFYKLEMPRTSYAKGEPIDIQLSVRNITSKPISLTFDQDLEFDFLVQSEVNLLFVQVPQDVWRLSADPEHLPKRKPHVITIPPGKEKIFRSTWTQEDYKGKAVEPGRYIISGQLNAKDRQEQLQLRGETK